MCIIIPKLFRARKRRFQFVEHGNLLSFPSMTRLLSSCKVVAPSGHMFERITPAHDKYTGLLLSRGQGSGTENQRNDLKHRRGCGDGCRNNSSVFLGSLNTKLGGASVGERCQWRGNQSPWRITVSVEPLRVHSISPHSSPKLIL